jgi:hypothetical protein
LSAEGKVDATLLAHVREQAAAAEFSAVTGA